MWQHTINTALLNFSGSSTAPNAMLGYTSNPAPGNMYFSLSAGGGSDAFGNTFPTGLSVQSGQVQGVSLIGTSMDATSTLLGSSIHSPQVLTPNINGGTASGLTHVITSTGGSILGYTAQTSSVTFATNGVYHWTCPTGVTSARVQCWAAGAGGNGAVPQSNGQVGGEGAGAGEYAEEPHYPVVPGTVYQVVVGQGGLPGSLNQVGSDGMPTLFYPTGGVGAAVQANQGLANGTGGSGSINTVHFNGGSGAGSNGGTGGGGGGSSAGPAAQGNSGSAASGGTGGAGGTAVSGGGAGGTGGNSSANGSNAGAPGGGGGGGGSCSSSSSQIISYSATASASYYGSDAPALINQRRVINGLIYQGGETASGGAVNGTQKSLFSFPQSKIQSDWTGWTINSCTLFITNIHSWYNSGMTVLIGTYNATTTPPSIWNGSGSTAVVTADIAEGARHGFGLGATVGKQFAAQTGPTVYQIAFGPGPAFDLNYYGYFNGTPNNGNGPVLTIAGTPVGATGGTGGSGGDGQVIITYTNNATQQLILSVSTTTSTDSFGNTFQPGFTTTTASGGSTVVSPSGGVGGTTAVLFTPGGATHVTLKPQVWATSNNTGAANEFEALIVSSGTAGSQDETVLELISESADASITGNFSWIIGGVVLSQLLKTQWNIGVAISATLGTPSLPTVITTDSWQTMSLLANWSTLAGQPVPSYKYGIEKRVHFTGAAQFNVNIGANALATALPAGPYRPSSQIYIAPAPGSAGLQVSSNGGLVAVSIPGAATQFCNFDGSVPLDL